MAEYDVSSISGLLSTLWQVIVQVLRLNEAAYVAAVSISESWKIGLFILITAGLSYTLGQSVVLFANRVTRRNFYISLTISALSLAFNVILWAFTIWLLAEILFGGRQSLAVVLTVVAISFAPYLFGFLILIPYLGNIIGYVLRIWVLLAVIVGVSAAFQFSFWQALACSALGWILLELLSRIRFLQYNRLDNWLWRVSTGTEQRLLTEDIVEQYIEQEKTSTLGEEEA
ncbi:MAG: YIP1 family protein [Candidatus Promineifilaceae bacterium]|nr:YIP1 family protein [Candidatus Promineifilaceae bacterium]